MGFLGNILTTITTYGDGFGLATLKYEWIYKFISWLVSIAGDLGLGIILFTLALKLVTLPMDIISRASMKKNSLKMEQMKPELEKLQKQYANNKELYQQKMMALYKKNGYSAFSACLPTIVTLVFFFIVLAGFQSFSKYVNKEVFNEMGKAYTLSVEETAKSGALISENGAYYVNVNAVLKSKGYEEYFNGYSEVAEKDESVYSFKDISALSGEFIQSAGISEYIVAGNFNYDNAELFSNINLDAQDRIVGLLSEDKRAELSASGVISLENGKRTINSNNLFYEVAPESVKKYFKNTAKEGEEAKYEIDLSALFADYADLKATYETEAKKETAVKAIKKLSEDYLKDEVKILARAKAKEAYFAHRSHSAIIPWVNNLWVVDSPFSKAIPTYSEFKTQMQNKSEDIGTLTEEAYNEITYDLEEFKGTGFGKGNGYFILVAISILAMLGSTLITQKMQKTQMELSTVDGANGTSATSQKMMTWMMPMMFGVFAFMYSAAFSLYMITSTLLSTGSTMLINFFVERGFKKKIQEEEAVEASKTRYGKRR